MIALKLGVAALVCALAAAPPPAAAQEPTPAASPAPLGPADPCGSILSIVTRPTVTTSVCTVRTGHALLENGYTNTVTTGTAGGNTAAYPQSFLRIGSADPHLEFSFTAPSVTASSNGATFARGASDINFGAKYELGYGTKWLYGVNGVVSVPTGTRAFSAGDAQFTGNFNWSYAVSSVIGLAGTVGFNALSGFNSAGSAQSYFAFVPSLEATATLPGNSELFGEYAYFSQAGVGLGGKNLFDFGYVHDFGAHVQFDAEYGFLPTLINGQRQHYAGAGLSFMY
jgi:hypothetical protein